jgi:VIT1/CCC1 family predicted Fe2+/Mn2+ transporter
MSEDSIKSSKHVLDPADRVSEVLFGLIMVLTFTGSLSVAEAGRSEVGTMLIGALGCNLAWGIIDGVLYLMGCLAERRSEILTLRAVRATADPHEAHRLIAEALPQPVASVLEPADLEMLRQRLVGLPEPPERAALGKEDWLGMVYVFFHVFLSMFPVAIPFFFLKDVFLALRISNGIAMAMLFAMGYAFGGIIGRRPWVTGISMVFLGGALVGITMALGG